MPALSVIVPATDRPESLPRCVAAIDAALSGDDELTVVESAPLPTPASARNEGATGAAGDVLVFVDADVEVHPDALRLIRARFAGDPDLVAVFGGYDDDPAERDVVSTFRNLLHHHVHQEGAGPIDSFWSGLGAVRRSSFRAVGGFDDGMRSVEDIELGARLSAAEGRIELDPAIQGKHLKRWTVPTMLHTDLILRGIPWTQMALRREATRGALNLGWRHRVSAAASALMLRELLRRRAAPAMAALLALCVINRRFYRLLAARGPRYLVAGIALHVMHHLTNGLAVLAGALLKPGALPRIARGGRSGQS